jgi:peptide/nickel transport system substrate-binding protein
MPEMGMRRHGAVKSWVIGSAVAVCFGLSEAHAADLSIGVSAAPSSLDPYYHNIAPNLAITHHVFDRLVRRGPDRRPGRFIEPGLAESWSRISDTVWEFKLRRGVTFHDGSPFTAEDVAAGFARAPRVAGAATLAIYIRAVKRLEVVDDFTVRLHTDGPYPLLLNDLSQFPILPRSLAQATTDDFRQADRVIGTGPFRIVEWRPGERLEMVANPDYWDGRPVWDRVTLRFLPDDAQRLAALAAGAVDVIDNVPAADLPRIRANPNFQVTLGQTGRVIFLRFNFGVKPQNLRDKAGRPLESNPFRDPRVRRAVSLAVNRAALRDLDMEGLAQPAAQLTPDDYDGASPALKPAPYDPATAKSLLRAAGYPQGFVAALQCTNDRYLNDDKLCLSIARMLTAVGIETAAEAMPANAFFPRAARGEFDLMMSGWGSSTGETSYALKGLLATRGARPGWGGANHGGYSNPQVDAALAAALPELDDVRRAGLLRGAVETAINEDALIPLHFQMRAVTFRRGLRYEPSKEEAMPATDFKPEP